MKPDKPTLSLLFDFYGELLTEKQRDCFELYCNQDLTLAEIAELMGVSRQGVHDAVSRAEAQLLRMEEVTHCLRIQRRNAAVAADLDCLAEALADCAPAALPEKAAALRAAARALKE